MKENYTYTVYIEEAEEGGYIATVPALDNIMTQGETLEEIHFMAKDLIHCYLEALKELKEEIPTERPSSVAQIHVSLDTPVLA